MKWHRKGTTASKKYKVTKTDGNHGNDPLGLRRIIFGPL